jgi:hypothetical protein
MLRSACSACSACSSQLRLSEGHGLDALGAGVGGTKAVTATHIRVATQLLDNSIVKVARIAQEAAGNVVGVFEAVEGIVNDGELRALAELQLPALGRLVEVQHPRVVGSGLALLHMVLELYNV